MILPTLGRPNRSRTRRVLQWLLLTTQTGAAALAGLVIIAVVLPTKVGQRLGSLLLPLLLILSVTLIWYVGYLQSRYPDALGSVRLRSRGAPHFRARAFMLLILGLLGALWGVSVYGDRVGTRVANRIAAGLPNQPAVVLYSTERIALAGTGLMVAEIIQPDTKYHYQYSGMRLLVRSGDKYLLLPVGWQRGRDRVFFVRDDESVRIDIAVVS